MEHSPINTPNHNTRLYSPDGEEGKGGAKKGKWFRILKNTAVVVGGVLALVAVFVKGSLRWLTPAIVLVCVSLVFGPQRVALGIWWRCVNVHHKIHQKFKKPKYTCVDSQNHTFRKVTTLPPRPTVPHRRIICVSDTHTLHDKIIIPEGDILVHCGDILFQHEEKPPTIFPNLFMETNSVTLLKSFNNWLGEQPVKACVVIAGNHDKFCHESGAEKISEILSNAVYLENSFANVEGVGFVGMPVSPNENVKYNAWQCSDAELKEIVKSVAEKSSDKKVDVLVTHSRPFGPVEDFVAKNKPKFILSGHNHSKYGVWFSENNVLINCASLNVLYMPVHPPVVFDYIL